jgi:hypothetical protein
MSHEFELNDLTKLELDQDLVGQSSPAVMKRVLEYANLAALPQPSAQQEERLGEILAKAVDDEVLSFWITEVDHLLGHYLNLLDEDDRESYQDQQALLREYAGTESANFPVPKHQQVRELVCCPLIPDCDTSDRYPNNEPIIH